ncbi:CFEM domain-containing protein [Colletotrichum graminicola M1.001]|uniref:CFEM domain-containing protein n=1 Tax=Colletotrichum graminicola (strain M1.001 / M2 / FGSC 10212) TaxID=645133 RepID=E3QHZ7_COLGM|nr:CFEM domain-containing protein [Colletotrichum graminicola M1.001]EFQ30485.1 CFEM domain-containing protein [Colletotrichum graminicola M1.001]
MQFKIAAVALFASFTAAQDLSLLPDCATDFACICASSAYNNAVTTCVLGACQFLDALAAQDWATKTCSNAGVPI